MTESVTFTIAAKRTLNKISRNRQHTSRREFGAAWAKWAKDRPYPELIAALERVEYLLDAVEGERPTVAELIAAMVAVPATYRTQNVTGDGVAIDFKTRSKAEHHKKKAEENGILLEITEVYVKPIVTRPEVSQES